MKNNQFLKDRNIEGRNAYENRPEAGAVQPFANPLNHPGESQSNDSLSQPTKRVENELLGRTLITI